MSIALEGLVVPEEYLRSYDEHRYLIEEEQLRSNWFSAQVTGEYQSPRGFTVSLGYTLRKDWYQSADMTEEGFLHPDDLFHKVDGGLLFAAIMNTGPGGIIPIGLSFQTGAEYEYFQGFDPWGISGQLKQAPRNDWGTLKCDLEIFAGTKLSKAIDARVALGMYGGTNFYDRTYYRLGSSGPLGDSQLYLRGYRSGEFLIKSAAVTHLNMGYEILPGTLHLSLFGDGALVKPYNSNGMIPSEWRPLVSAGVTASFILPWEISGQMEVAQGFLDLTGSTSHYHTTITLQLMRSFSLK